MTAECTAHGATLPDVMTAWRPDAECIATGDNYAELASRCWAAAGLSDEGIRLRFLHYAGTPDVPKPLEIEPSDAARAFALHLTFVGLPPEETARRLGALATSIPGWQPCDADEIAALTEYARGEIEG
jgi:hypothetical protein